MFPTMLKSKLIQSSGWPNTADHSPNQHVQQIWAVYSLRSCWIWANPTEAHILPTQWDESHCVLFDMPRSQAFEIISGIKQRCVLAPNLYFAILLEAALQNSECTSALVPLRMTYGSLFDLARLKTKVRQTRLHHLLFADDVSPVAHNPTILQEISVIHLKTRNRILKMDSKKKRKPM